MWSTLTSRSGTFPAALESDKSLLLRGSIKRAPKKQPLHPYPALPVSLLLPLTLLYSF